MRIAVIHHSIRDDAIADLNALVGASRRACEAGAHAVVLPFVPALRDLSPEERGELVGRINGCEEGAGVYVSFEGGNESGPRILDTPLGLTALLGGDACLRPNVLEGLVSERLDTMVWRPRAESELQAEAILEFAQGCALALSGVLLIAESGGGTGHDGSQGMSAIIHAGEIVAQAEGEEEEILLADVDVPQKAPEPGLALPVLPIILGQRVAVHEGRRPQVEYPAELS